MGQITPQMVKELREKTGAGMGDCKNALTDSNGDIQAAIEVLRKKGAASAVKRADRSANEGLVITRVSADNKKAVIVEANCETDFVGRNAEFEKFVVTVADTLLKNDIKNVEDLMGVKVGTDTIKDLHNEILAKFGEKINIRRFEKITSNGSIVDYIHAGSRLAVLIDSSVASLTDKTKGMLRDLAMQIAAMNPSFVDRSVVTAEQIAKEKEIYTELAITEGKKPDIAERIATGKLEKFYQEQCLVEQTFVKDPNKTVTDVIKEISTEAGSEVKINGFKRYFLGEEL